MADPVQTSYLMSEIHLANFNAEIKRCTSAEDLKKIAKKHAPYGLKRDVEKATEIYNETMARRGWHG
jgi:hypothetical protein